MAAFKPESQRDSSTPSLTSDEGGVAVKPFAYWRDPLCWCSWGAYIVNRWVLVPNYGHTFPFLREHFNDSLLIPAALPLLLGVRRWLKLRSHDSPPTWEETLFWLVGWSLFFEFLGPRWFGYSVADAADVLAYWVGGVLSWLGWQFLYRRRSRATTSH